MIITNEAQNEELLTMQGKLKTFKIFMTMVIHDLKNPTLSLKNGNDLAFTRFQNIDTYKTHQKEMDKQQNKLIKQRKITKNNMGNLKEH